MRAAFWRKSCTGWTSGSSGFCRRSLTFSRRRNGRSRSRRQGPHPGRQAFPAAGGDVPARARVASPTAGRQASPAVGRRTSAAVGQRTSLVVVRRVASTFGRRTFLADGPRMFSAAARQASPAAGWGFSGRRAADVSLPDGKFPRCRAAHFLCCWAANFSYCRRQIPLAAGSELLPPLRAGGAAFFVFWGGAVPIYRSASGCASP